MRVFLTLNHDTQDTIVNFLETFPRTASSVIYSQNSRLYHLEKLAFCVIERIAPLKSYLRFYKGVLTCRAQLTPVQSAVHAVKYATMAPIVDSGKDHADKDLSAEPYKTVTYGGKEYDTVKEGLAEILNATHTQKGQAKKRDPKPQAVFYNPIQQFNRDLSVLAIRVFGEDLAAIRRARAERRLLTASKQEGKGKKRKRGALDESQSVEDQAHAGKNETKGRGSLALAASTQNGPSVQDRDAVDRVMEEGLSHSDGMSTAAETEATGPVKKRNNEDSRDNPRKPRWIDGVQKNQDISKEPAAMRNGGSSGDGHKSAAESQAFRILDALSATGLRALRYVKEIQSVIEVTANDLSSSATALIKLNAAHNETSDKIIPTTGDARVHMYNVTSRTSQLPYHVIDLDPYGTAAPFLDAAVQAVVDGGLLCVTSTDAGVFASTGYLEKTYSQYGGLPFKGPQSHEGGLRLIIHAIGTCAARYGRAIEPLLSLSIDFYARVFVRVRHSPADVKFLASKTMVVYNCDEGCGAWTIQPLAQRREKKANNGETFYKFSLAQGPSTSQHCEHCGFITHLAGPMWGGPLHNPYFVQRMLDILPSLDPEIYGTIPRMEGMLSLALNEFLDDSTQNTTTKTQRPVEATEAADRLSPSDRTPLRPIPSLPVHTRSNHPFFIIPSALAKVLHTVSPSSDALRGALLHLGYRATRSHTKPGSIVTDAPWSVIWEVMREWVTQKSPVKEGAVRKGTAGWGIMRKDRGKKEMVEAREEIRRACEVEDLEELKMGLEAALYRLSKTEAGTKTHQAKISGTEATDGEARNSNESGGVPLTKPERQSSPSQSRTSMPDTSQLNIVFDERLGKEPVSAKKVVRYQMNPRADWGPMNRAKGDLTG